MTAIRESSKKKKRKKVQALNIEKSWAQVVGKENYPFPLLTSDSAIPGVGRSVSKLTY